MNQKLAHATALYLDGIRDGHVRAAVEANTGERYTQHSTGVADGIEGFVEFFEPFIERNPVRDIQIIRSIVDGNFVFLHVFQDINAGQARWVTTDLFDTGDDDKIIEHWDVISAYTDERSLDGHTQIDGASTVVDLDNTESNKALVASFVDDVLVHGQIERLTDHVDGAIVQHLPGVADGIEAFREYLTGDAGRRVYRRVFKIIGEGNFVVTYSQVFDRQELATFDLWRVEHGTIVEHWENAEPLPRGPQPNGGKF